MRADISVGETVDFFAIVKASHTFTKPGTYFPVLRATSQRKGDQQTAFARVQNLGRVRVVVK